MTDDRLRAAERAWRDARDDEGAARYLRELRRLGRLDDRALELAALLRYAPARELLAGAAPEAPDEPDEWAAAIGKATAELGVDACLRAVIETAWRVPMAADRFDGPSEQGMRLLELLDDAALATGDARPRALERVGQALADEGGWGAYQVQNLAQLALTVLNEPENAATLLRDALLLLRQVAHDPEVLADVSRDLALFVLGLDDPSRRRLLERGRRFGAEGDLVRAIAFSPDGQRVVTTNRVGAVTVRDAATGEVLRAMRGRTTDLFAGAFTPDGARVVVGGLDGQLTVWDPATGEAVDGWRAHADGVTSLEVLPDGRLVSGGYDKVVRVWPPTGRDALLTLEGHERTVWALAASPDGGLLASGGSDARAVLWDLAAGAARWTATHPAGVTGVAFMPDGAQLLTACDDGHLRRFDVATGQELAAHRVDPRGIIDMALSPDGALVATVGTAAARLTRVADGGAPERARAGLAGGRQSGSADDGSSREAGERSRRTHHTDDAEVRSWTVPGVQLVVAFAPDGTWALVGARSGALRRFDVT